MCVSTPVRRFACGCCVYCVGVSGVFVIHGVKKGHAHAQKTYRQVPPVAQYCEHAMCCVCVYVCVCVLPLCVCVCMSYVSCGACLLLDLMLSTRDFYTATYYDLHHFLNQYASKFGSLKLLATFHKPQAHFFSHSSFFPCAFGKKPKRSCENPSRETATGPALPSTTDIMPVYVRARK